MTFKPKIWFPIAAVLSAANVASVYIAAAPGEAWHATLHGALAAAFAVWAQRLYARLRAGAPAGDPAQVSAPVQHQLAAFNDEMDQLRLELSETQERLDFAERMLAQSREQRRQP